MTEITGVILAGGKSTRMGMDKAFIPIGQTTMIKKIASELRKVFSRVMVVSNKREFLYQHLGLPVVNDLRSGCGPLGGIHAGLTFADTPYIFVVACDMPFIDARLIPVLVGTCSGYDAVVPRIKECMEPLFAVYSKSCLPSIEQVIDNKNFKLVDLLSRLKVNYIDESRLNLVPDLKRVFININTPRDLLELVKYS
ncbi:molybdenum cofactor guanylyltransferase [Desulfofundulus thermosubterraneus]|uniref:Probable molybdenum cofactor guanylyltransferase n=1 Tax=Desulfofundulus thermosubterraneus DSM 16057 TaxID=1121432 RepID=A0A1M6E7A3_9FIRM|nr:molybdenum cofactor guanylyltransferase [Desulfofundulus thermosubterraneus]SHI81240.1 molybdopterin-guanine dinucleotide biosynthesis protein A [Desulfofundulus thermosubterraneus DSM 16057]